MKNSQSIEKQPSDGQEASLERGVISKLCPPFVFGELHSTRDFVYNSETLWAILHWQTAPERHEENQCVMAYGLCGQVVC